jgi:prepilin-type processing-associated H-X9-DG protein
LIVIVIIAVLGALLVPLVSKIREKAQATKCVDNLRGWGIAIRGYANDHNGFVQYSKWASVGDTARLYENDLGGDFEAKTRDLDGRKVYLQEIARRCPAQNKSSSVGYGFVRPQPQVSASSQPQGYNLASATEPGSLLLMIDTINNSGINLENKESLKTYVYPVCQGADVRHNHNVNAVFGDGHIGVYKWSDIDGDSDEEVAKITKWFTLHP